MQMIGYCRYRARARTRARARDTRARASARRCPASLSQMIAPPFPALSQPPRHPARARPCSRARALPLWLRPYRILSLSRDSGLIELVHDAASIEGLSRGRAAAPVRGLAARALHRRVGLGCRAFEVARRKFLNSVVGYAVVCYLLAIKARGARAIAKRTRARARARLETRARSTRARRRPQDRHNGNALLDAEGHLVQIDFGFILGMAPGEGVLARAGEKERTRAPGDALASRVGPSLTTRRLPRARAGPQGNALLGATAEMVDFVICATGEGPRRGAARPRAPTSGRAAAAAEGSAPRSARAGDERRALRRAREMVSLVFILPVPAPQGRARGPRGARLRPAAASRSPRSRARAIAPDARSPRWCSSSGRASSPRAARST